MINPESYSQTISGLRPDTGAVDLWARVTKPAIWVLPPPCQPIGHTSHPCLPVSLHLLKPPLPALRTPPIPDGCGPVSALVEIQMQAHTQSSARWASSLPRLEGLFLLLTLLAFYISATCELASACVFQHI